MNVAVPPGVGPTAGADVIGNRPGRNEGITAVDGNHLARKGRRCGDTVNTIETVEYAEWIREIGHLAPFAVRTGLGPGILTSAHNRFQYFVVRADHALNRFSGIGDAKTLENQISKTLWCGW
jgi:hypothetical protein